MQNRAAADIEQTLRLLLNVMSQKDIRDIITRLQQQHGNEAVARLNKMLATAAENITTELTDLYSLSSIIKNAEAQHPGDPAKQANTARKGITLFVNRLNKPLMQKCDEVSTLKKTI